MHKQWYRPRRSMYGIYALGSVDYLNVYISMSVPCNVWSMVPSTFYHSIMKLHPFTIQDIMQSALFSSSGSTSFKLGLERSTSVALRGPQ